MKNKLICLLTVKNKALLTPLVLICIFGICLAKEPENIGNIKGKFIGTYEATDNPVCKLFTRNLNEFRDLSFLTCNPRLSPKFPEFSRPAWEEIPFDLELAEEFIKGQFGRIEKHPEVATRAEKRWQEWLVDSTPIRRAGKARMWRTRIDVDGDGKEEILIRVLPGGVVNGQTLETEPPFSCDYNAGQLHMTDGADQLMMDSFNRSGVTDIINYANDKRAFLVDWTPSPPTYPRIQLDTGATAGVILSTLGRNIGGPQCRVDWVPNKKHRSPKIRISK